MDTHPGTVTNRVWRDGTVHTDNCPALQVPEFLDDEGCLVWIDLCEPNHGQLSTLARELNLHPLAIEDAVAHLERTKAIRYGKYTVLTAYATQRSRDCRARRCCCRPQPGWPITSPSGVDPAARPDIGVHPAARHCYRAAPRPVRHDASRPTDGRTTPICSSTASAALCTGCSTSSSTGSSTPSRHSTTRSRNRGRALRRASPSAEIQRRTYRIRKDLVELRRVVLPMREVVNTSPASSRGPTTAPSPNSTARTTISTTTCCAPRSGRSRCATWSPPCSRPICPCRTPG